MVDVERVCVSGNDPRPRADPLARTDIATGDCWCGERVAFEDFSATIEAVMVFVGPPPEIVAVVGVGVRGGCDRERNQRCRVRARRR